MVVPENKLRVILIVVISCAMAYIKCIYVVQALHSGHGVKSVKVSDFCK